MNRSSEVISCTLLILQVFFAFNEVIAGGRTAPGWEAEGQWAEAENRRNSRGSRSSSPSREALWRRMLEVQSQGGLGSLFRLEWQMARLCRAEGEAEEAMEWFSHALAAVEQAMVETGEGKESAGELYREAADLLLESAGELGTEEERQGRYERARQVMERFRADEVEEYFRDECAERRLARAQRVEATTQGTAVMYPILFRDRVEVLLALPGGMERLVLKVGREEFTEAVIEFRRLLEKRTTQEFLTAAWRLNQWLMAPIQEVLRAKGVGTIVHVPDGVLRMIPLGALHDGTQFAAERYSIVVTPGLTLLDPRPVGRRRVRSLVCGLTRSREGEAELHHVADEMAHVGTRRGRRMMDREFRFGVVEKELRNGNYELVHIASHAQFEREARNSFIQTHDRRMGLDELERLIRPGQYRGTAVELLVLSACETAAGDDRAALGLAGVAYKSGARSVLGSLWHVNDQATAELMRQFYRAWTARPEVTKAEALRRAQLELLKDRRFRHPCYWAGFVLIGNWL